MRKFIEKIGFSLLLVCVLSSLVFASKQPIVEYLFNETGSIAESTGWDKTPLILKDKNGERDLHTEGGLGVSGSPNDRAFDNYWWEKGSGNHGIAEQEKYNKDSTAQT